MITERSKQEILDRASLLEVAEKIDSGFKKKGASYTIPCPFCGHESKFSIHPAKDIYKCFSCDVGGKGAVDYLMNRKKINYPQALQEVADMYNIVVEHEPKEISKPVVEKKKREALMNNISFRNQQLKDSGLELADITIDWRQDDETIVKFQRYEAKTLNERMQVVDGDDMVMHYFNLEGQPMKFVRQGFSKEFPLVRVRWQNPELHLDRNGTPIKYQSPKQSGSALWLPNKLIRAYQNKVQFDTLYIHEGEKKADKACKHNMYAVGIMGIHNIANNQQLPHEFELIIKFCGVKKVVFCVDADFMDISSNPKKPADGRPRSFLKAVNNFKDYFAKFFNMGITVDLYFAHIKPEHGEKGIDDLMAKVLPGKEEVLHMDFDKTMNNKSGDGDYINCYKITSWSYYQLQEKFHLQTTEAFANYHRKELEARGIFRIGKELWHFNPENYNKLELAQPIGENEKFWLMKTRETKAGPMTTISFDYQNCYLFLQNRGFWRYELPNGNYAFVSIDNRIVKIVEPGYIKDYLIQFTENINEKELLNMIYRGAKMYVGPESLSNLKYHTQLNFHKSSKDVQYMYFQETCWRITADKIQAFSMQDLDGYVWKNNIIDFSSTLLEPLVSVKKVDDVFTDIEKNVFGGYEISVSTKADKCHFSTFLLNTSKFQWQKPTEQWSKYDYEECMLHYLNKITAFGYMLHTFRDDKVAKAVVAMDAKMSEVGASNGRSGKSLFGEALRYVLPTVYIPGKAKDLAEDKFVFEEVTPQTRIVWIDDVRVNFDFEWLFPMITGQMKVEGKGIKRYTIPKEDTPKFYIPTNHAINGTTGSFTDRQVLLAFSDWYHKNSDGSGRQPIDDFGVMMFSEWDTEQRNLFYNFCACAVKTYFEHGLIAAPTEMLEKRRMRQQIGEQLLEWAEEYYSNDNNRNRDIPKIEMVEDFYRLFPKQKQFIDAREFKKRLRLICMFKGWVMNPGYKSEGRNWGGDIKRGGIEYIQVLTGTDGGKYEGEV